MTPTPLNAYIGTISIQTVISNETELLNIIRFSKNKKNDVILKYSILEKNTVKLFCLRNDVVYVHRKTFLFLLKMLIISF